MRSVVRILAAGMLWWIGVAGQNWAQAQAPSLSSRPTLTFRAAAVTEVPGFKLMSSPEGRYYVGPKVLFTGDDVIGAGLMRPPGRATLSDGDTALALRLRRDLAFQVLRLMQGDANRLAIIVNGTLIAAPTVRTATTTADNALFLSGLPQRIAMHVINLVAKTGAGTGSATVKVTLASGHPRVEPGGVLTVDVYIARVRDLRGYQLQAVATGALVGQLPLENLLIDKKRPDYVFGQAQVIDAVDRKHGRILGALFEGVAEADEPRYLGTYSFRTPEGVQDTYYVNIAVGSESYLRDSQGMAIPFTIGSGAVVSSGVPQTPHRAKPSRGE